MGLLSRKGGKEYSSVRGSHRSLFKDGRKKTQTKLVIGTPSPADFKHRGHVEVDPNSSTGFKGLPEEWRQILKTSTITKERVLKDQDKVLTALQFYAKKVRVATVRFSTYAEQYIFDVHATLAKK